MANHPHRNPASNRSMILGMMVGSDLPVIVYGSERGLVSEHHTVQGATDSLRRDQAGCRKQGGYSDANIYVWVQNLWCVQPGGMHAD